ARVLDDDSRRVKLLAGVRLLLQDGDPQSRASQGCRAGQSGEACSDDDAIVIHRPLLAVKPSSAVRRARRLLRGPGVLGLAVEDRARLGGRKGPIAACDLGL